MILAAIIACEIAFWVAIIAGLVTRYALKRPRLGAAFLIAAPVVDAILLTLVCVDLLGGGTASWHHGLAAIYLGISVAYGHRMVAWVDVKYTQWFRGGPAPKKIYGAAYMRKCWADAARTAVAMLIALGIVQALIWVVGDAERTAALADFRLIIGIVAAADILWAVSYTVWPKTPRFALK
ncbi:MAG: hypothetical protein ACK5IM_11445 [Demequina sp.]|uniref:hypothetical protein n=1 Tax=Demequina sp. TaxID=2050685 RepID=UPI003A83FD16